MAKTNLDTLTTTNENFLEIKNIILTNPDSHEIGLKLKKINKFINNILNDKEIKNKITEDTKLFLQNNKSEEVSYVVVSSVFDFSKCNHIEYDSLIKIKNEILKRIKTIEKNDLIPLLKLKDQQVFENGKLINTKQSKKIVVEFTHNYHVLENGEEFNEIFPPENVQEYGLRYTV